MYYFSFFEPKYYDGKIESLSDFISLIGNDESILRYLSNEFPSKKEKVDTNEMENSYRTFIADMEDEVKYDFSRFLRAKLRDNVTEKQETFTVFYRGISDESFKPVPSIYRGNNFKYEDRFINDIRVSNPDFVEGKTYIDELSALQHYGCPTRLLDLTSNPLVALYFACEDALKDNSQHTDGCVEMFLTKEKDILHSNSDKVLILTALTHLTKDEKDQLLSICDNEIITRGFSGAKLDKRVASRKSVKKLYQEILRETNFEKEINCIDLLQSFYVQPAFNNLRIRAQNGLFLINGLCQNARECSLRNENKIFARVIIPFNSKKKILEELDRISINSKTLFPEIEDTVDYLKNKYK